MTTNTVEPADRLDAGFIAFLLIGGVFAGFGVSTLLATDAHPFGWANLALGATFWTSAFFVRRSGTRKRQAQPGTAEDRRNHRSRHATYTLIADLLMAVCVTSLTITGCLMVVAFAQQTAVSSTWSLLTLLSGLGSASLRYAAAQSPRGTEPSPPTAEPQLEEPA